MKVYCVYHFIHVRTPYVSRAKLFITDVPTSTDVQEVKSTLTRAGYEFGEFGIGWGNHPIEEFDGDSDDALWGAWNRGDVETVTWSALRERAGFNIDDLTKRKRQVRDMLNKFDFSKSPEVLDKIEALLTL